MSNYNRFGFVSREAVNENQCNSNIEFVWFHAYNDNGAFTKTYGLDLDYKDQIFVECHRNNLLKQAKRKRISRFDALYHVREIEKLIENTKKSA